MDISFPIQLHLFLEKGTRLHKINGKLWVVLMLIASFSSFFIMPTDSLTWLHLFAILVILTVLVGLGVFINTINNCILVACLGTVTSAVIALIVPGRLLHNIMFKISNKDLKWANNNQPFSCFATFSQQISVT